MTEKIQAILFPKDKFSLERAKLWISKNNYKTTYRSTDDFYRFMQNNPINLKNEGYDKIRTQKLISGIEMIIYFKET